MKFIDRLILGLFAIVMLMGAIFSTFVILNWIDALTIIKLIVEGLKNPTVCHILLGVNVVIIILAIKAIFFENLDSKEEYEGKGGILLQNDDGKLLITKETLKNMVNVAVSGFSSVKSAQTKIILDANNDLYITLTMEVADNAIIKELTNNIQMKVKEAIKASMDVEVKSIDIKITNIVKSPNTEEK